MKIERETKDYNIENFYKSLRRAERLSKESTLLWDDILSPAFVGKQYSHPTNKGDRQGAT